MSGPVLTSCGRLEWLIASVCPALDMRQPACDPHSVTASVISIQLLLLSPLSIFHFPHGRPPAGPNSLSFLTVLENWRGGIHVFCRATYTRCVCGVGMLIIGCVCLISVVPSCWLQPFCTCVNSAKIMFCASTWLLLVGKASQTIRQALLSIRSHAFVEFVHQDVSLH